jgi:hypothetical protein
MLSQRWRGGIGAAAEWSCPDLLRALAALGQRLDQAPFDEEGDDAHHDPEDRPF